MAGSTDYAIPRLLWAVRSLRPRRVLDVGCGGGKFGVFFRFALDEVFGPEAAAEVTIDGLDAVDSVLPRWRSAYDTIYKCSLTEAIPTLAEYDLIYLGDIIEHFQKDEGHALLSGLLARTRLGVLLNTPLHFLEQGALNGNAFERHVSLWTEADFGAYQHHWCWVEYRRTLVALIAPTPLSEVRWKNFSTRSPLSSTVERVAFALLPFPSARRLKAAVTRVPVQE